MQVVSNFDEWKNESKPRLELLSERILPYGTCASQRAGIPKHKMQSDEWSWWAHNANLIGVHRGKSLSQVLWGWPRTERGWDRSARHPPATVKIKGWKRHLLPGKRSSGPSE